MFKRSFRKAFTNEMGIHVITFKNWVVFALALLILFFALLWIFFGYIPVAIKGRGILIAQKGLFSIQARIDGTITNIKIGPEDIVKKGDLLMEIYDSQLELKYQEATSRVNTLSEQLNHLKKQISEEEKAEKEAILTKIAAAQFVISQIEDEIEFLNRELKKREQLVEEGLISGSLLRSAKQNILQKKIDFEEKIGSLASLQSQYRKEYRPIELQTKEEQLIDEIEQQQLYQLAIELGKIRSPYEGKALEVLVSPGDRVKVGSTLAWMENLSQDISAKNYLIYAYFPVEMGKRIQINMPISMEVSTVNSNQYGMLKGHVKEVSLFAVSKENIYNKIHNLSLVEYLTNQSPAVIQVLIEPDVDPENEKLFHWTSGEQPPVPITTGTVGSINATVEKIRPIFYLLPLPKMKYYSDSTEQPPQQFKEKINART